MEIERIVRTELDDEVVEMEDRSKGCDQNVFLIRTKVFFSSFVFLSFVLFCLSQRNSRR